MACSYENAWKYTDIVETFNDKNIKIIAFDVFDTIISRKIKPEDVHCEWAKKMIQDCEINLSLQKLLIYKKFVGKISKGLNIFSGKDREINYKQTIFFLSKLLRLDYHKLLDLSLKNEILVEVENDYILPESRFLYNCARTTGKRVIFISDFYVPYAAMKNLFQYFQVEPNMAYISCDYIATKWSGRLYEVVIKSERCDPHELVMIGDNFKSDVVKAKEKGFSSFLFEIHHFTSF